MGLRRTFRNCSGSGLWHNSARPPSFNTLVIPIHMGQGLEACARYVSTPFYSSSFTNWLVHDRKNLTAHPVRQIVRTSDVYPKQHLKTTANMPASLISTCSPEDERLYLETITHFLAKADTQALHTALTSLQTTVSALETRLTTLQNVHTKLATTNEAVQTNNEALQARLESCLALNDALRAKHDDLQRNVEAAARASAEMRISTEELRGSVEALRSRVLGMAQQRDREQHQGSDKAAVLALQGQITQVEIRLEDVEGVVEHVARLVGRGMFTCLFNVPRLSLCAIHELLVN